MSLTIEDRERLIQAFNQLTQKIPGMFKPMILRQSLPQYLAALPEEFKDYTLRELADTLNEAWSNDEISW